jgi:hypothetical protein
MEEWAPGSTTDFDAEGGLEILVLTGAFSEGGEQFARYSWLRLPIGAHLRAQAAAPDGCRVWIKEGHLRHVRGLEA